MGNTPTKEPTTTTQPENPSHIIQHKRPEETQRQEEQDEREDESEAAPDISTIPNIPGARIAALSGVAEDEQPVEFLNKGARIVDITVKTGKTKKAFELIQGKAQATNAEIVGTLWTDNGNLRVMYALPTEDHANAFASNINTELAIITPQIRISEVSESDKIATYRGRVLFAGAGLSRTRESATLTQIPHPDGERMRIYRQKLQKLTHKSHEHCKDNLKTPRENIPTSTTIVRILLPNSITSAEEQLATIIGLIDDISDEAISHISMVGNRCDLLLGGSRERAVGNFLQRMGEKYEEIENLGIVITVDHGEHKVKRLDKNTHTIQDKLPTEPQAEMSPGIWGTNTFFEEADHERNKSLAKITKDETSRENTGTLRRIEKIEPVFFEVTVGGPRKTVGRAAEIDRIKTAATYTRKNRTTNFTIIEGQAGVGKTRLAVEAINLAREEEKGRDGKPTSKGMKTAYYKTLEDGKTQSGETLRKFIESILRQSNTLARGSFRDLEFYAGKRPVPKTDEAMAARVENLNKSSALVTQRTLELVQAYTKFQPLQVILDDLQWADAYSLEAIAAVIDSIEEKGNIHFVIMGRKDVGQEIPLKIKQAVERKTHKQTIELNNLPQSDTALIEEYVRASIDKRWENETIPNSFTQHLAELTAGLPLHLSEVLSVLTKRALIKQDPSTGALITPTVDELQELRNSGTTSTLDATIQAKLEHLSDREKDILDYLIIMGETDRDLFVSILAIHGYEEEEEIESSLKTMKELGITRDNPFGFVHDQTRTQREAQITGNGDVSRKAASCYETLDRNRKHPQVTSAMLFQTLRIALSNQEELTSADPEQVEKLKKAIVKESLAATDYCLKASKNLQARDIATYLLNLFTRYNPETTKDANTAQTHKRIQMILARIATRLGNPAQALKHLDAIATDAEALPRAGLLDTSYHALRTTAAYGARSAHGGAEAMKNATTALSTAVSAEKVKLIPKLTALETDAEKTILRASLTLAEGDLMISRIRATAMTRNPTALETLGKSDEMLTLQRNLRTLAKTARAQNNESLALEADALRLDITRQMEQMTCFINVFPKIDGHVEETRYLQSIEPNEKRALEELAGRMEKILEAYKTRTGLIRDPGAYGTLYVTLAEIYAILENHKRSGEIMSEALRMGQTWGNPEVAGRANKISADQKTARAIKDVPLDNPKKWDTSLLAEAVDHCKQGIGEFLRTGTKTSDYLTGLALNKAFAAGLLATSELAKPENEKTLTQDQLKQLVTDAWEKMLPALAEVKTAYYGTYKQGQPDYRPIYLHEAAMAGLLFSAGKKLELNLPTSTQIQHGTSTTEFCITDDHMKEAQTLLAREARAVESLPQNLQKGHRTRNTLLKTGTTKWLDTTYEVDVIPQP